MFPDEVRVERETDIPFGTSKVDPEKSMYEIKKLLKKMGCERILTDELGDTTRIMFVIDAKPFTIKIPKVYIRKGRGIHRPHEYYPWVGPRLVQSFLKGALTSIQFGVSPEILMIGARVVKTNKDGTHENLADHIDRFVPKDPLLSGGSQ